MSTTSIAAVYAVMIETGFNRTELGKIILAACYGRVETRVGIVAAAKGLAEHHEFPGLKAFGRIESRANIAVLRRRALDIARLDSSKGSLTTKLKRAGWDDEFML